jgi:16S rRNA (adenine(1408)-N(1))-methyltransferase
VVIDLGTGDGAAVIRGARRSPTVLHIGIDSDSASLRDASRRASRPAGKGGLPNALFVVAAAEALPAELGGRADSVTVTLPWGSLLRAVLEPDPRVVRDIRGLLRPQGRLEVLVSVSERDHGLPALDGSAWCVLADQYRDLDLVPCVVRPAAAADVAASGSSWAKRLGIPVRRAAWWASFERRESDAGNEVRVTGV